MENSIPLPLQGDQAIIQGATFILPLYLFNENGQPIDLTDYTAAMQGRVTVNAAGDDQPIFDWNTEDGQITIEETTGTVMIVVPSAETALLPETVNAVYDLFLYSPDGLNDIRLLFGPFDIEGRVTR